MTPSPQPWLSVVMPTYNGAAYLEAALESVCRERDEAVEVVVADDGSSDATLEILASYEARLPLRVVGRRRVGNWIAGTNFALREARGRYACFLHQDDVWLPGRLRSVRRELERARVTMLVTSATFIDAQGRAVGAWRLPFPAATLAEPAAFLERLLVQNFIAIASPVFDRAAALDVGALDESLWFTADWDFWLKLAAAGPVRTHAGPLVGFRVHHESQTMARHRTRCDFEQQLATVLDRHFPRWAASIPPRRARAVRAAAEFSVFANALLAGVSRGDPVPWREVLASSIRLGPAGWRRYLRDSRIVERVASRLRLRAS